MWNPIDNDDRGILLHLIRGLSNAEIAERLHLSLGTVKARLRELRALYHANNSAELAAKVQHHIDTGDGPVDVDWRAGERE